MSKGYNDDMNAMLGGLSVAIGLLAFVPYLRDLGRGATKPHPFTWLVWALVYAIVFFAQWLEGAGPGAWFAGAEALASVGIAVFAIFRGEKRIAKID